jgi:hypothetical protein
MDGLNGYCLAERCLSDTSSRHVIVGPDAAIALLVGATIVDWLSPFAQPISRIPAKRITSIFIFSFQ